jgi:hypothetical protein
MARRSPVRGLHPAYRVYLVSFAMFVGAMASFAARVKVLGFVLVALAFVFAGIATVMLLALARRAKADLRATPGDHPGDGGRDSRGRPCGSSRCGRGARGHPWRREGEVLPRAHVPPCRLGGAGGAGSGCCARGLGLLVHRVFISLPIRCSASALACT